MFRSAEVQHFSLVTPRECAWNLFNGLGYLGCVQMIDAHPNVPHIQRQFANYIRRCDECLINIESIQNSNKYLEKMKLNLQYQPIFKPARDVPLVLQQFDEILKQRVLPGHTLFDEFENEIHKCFSSVHQQVINIDRLEETLTSTKYKLKALNIAGEILGKTLYMRGQNLEGSDFSFVPRVGIIDKETQLLFKKILFRVTKGNSWVNLLEFDEKHILYVVIIQDSSTQIKRKIDRVCEAMATQTFELPTSQQNYQEIQQNAESVIKDSVHLLEMSQNQLVTQISKIFQVNPKTRCSRLEELRLYVLKEKALYESLNSLKVQGSLFIGELWVIKQDVEKLEKFLFTQNSTSRQIGSLQLTKTNLTQPTYFQLNQFTRPFQWIVDTYGIPRYQEVNPAYVTCLTFPFLFGVMFGDVFHGACLFFFGLWLMQSYRDEDNFKVRSGGSILAPFHSVRFLIVLMGFFSMYNGLIYNEFAGMTLDLFGSCWEPNDEDEMVQKNGCTYPFGIDPAWQGSLGFINSYKMKQSVIIAYIHMTLGLLFQAVNYLFNGKYFLIFFKFLPQLAFFSCTFGYMDFLIVFKWLRPWNNLPDDPNNIEYAPSIINTMIDMVLRFGKVVGPPMFDLYNNQQSQIQFILLMIALGCVPVMWLAPIFKVKLSNTNFHDKGEDSIIIQNQSTMNDSRDGIDIELVDMKVQDSKSSDELSRSTINQEIEVQTHHNHDDEVVVHETIETIEFTLGCVSNTASYLRLWALSLAHSQLAEVFWDLILASSIGNGTWYMTILMYPGWALFTLGVLLCMDSMECFLHSLRLHWVEFQNKFYKGDGIAFQQYSFKVYLEEPRKE